MRTHFIKMFNYDRFANDLILNSIIEANEPQRPLQLFSHLLTANQVWLSRCKGIPHEHHNAWTEYTITQCQQLVGICHDNWIIYLEELPDADFNKVINYQNFKGDHMQDQLSDIFTHVINHGTHTRAQAGQQLRFAGVQSLPLTDYIYYLRQLKSNI